MQKLLNFKMGKLFPAIWKDYKIRATSKSVLITQFLRYFIVFTILVVFHEVQDLFSLLFMRLLLPYSLLMATQATIVDLANEKQSGLRDFLRIHGLKNSTSDIAKVLVEAVQSAIVALIFAIIFTQSSLLTGTNPQILFVFIFMYLTTSSALSCFLVRYCSEPNSAAGLVIWLNAMTYLVFLAIKKEGMLYTVMSVFPLTSFCQALWQITDNEFGKTMLGQYYQSLDGLGVVEIDYWVLVVVMALQIPFFLFLASFRRNKQATHEAQTRDSLNSSLTSHLLDEYTDNAISIKNVVKRYGKLIAVNGVDLAVPRYGIFCLLGHNGAGKTTLLNLITGTTIPDSGAISINKNGAWSPVGIGDFGYCPQHDIQVEGFTVYEHVQLMAKLRGKPASSIMKSLQLMGLGHKVNDLFTSLSGGMKRRLTIAMADVGEPNVLILDEPTSGLDPETKGRLLQDLKDACKAKTVILTTHNMEEAEQLGDKISLMHRGEISNFNNAEELKRQCENCYFIQAELSTVGHVKQILEEMSLSRPESSALESKIVGSTKNQMIRIPLASSCSAEKLSLLFDRLEKEMAEGSVVFDSLSLQEAFVELYSQKENDFSGDNDASAQLDQVVYAANEIVNRQKVSSSSKTATVWRQFWTIFQLRLLELGRNPGKVFAFFFIPSIAIFDVTWRDLPQNIPFFDPADISLFYTSGVWVVVTSLIVAMAVYDATVHNSDKLKYWLRVNGIQIGTYWTAMVMYEWTTYMVRFGLVVIGITALNRDEPVKVDAILAIAPYQFIAGFPLVSGMLLMFRTFIHKNIVQKASFMIVYFGGYLLVYLMHLLVTYFDSEKWNHIVCFISLFDPIWTAFYVPVKKTQFVDTALQPNPYLETLTDSYMIQSVLGLFYFGLLIWFETRRIQVNSQNETTKSGVPSNLVVGATNCSKKYGRKTVVNNLDLHIEEGCIQGFTGPNGAGKSTSFNLLSLEVPKNGGRVDFWKSPIPDDLFLSVGVCPQETTVWPDLTLEDHIRLVARIKGFNINQEGIRVMLASLGIEKNGSVKAGALSGGNKRKLLILLSLLGSPKAKLLDEPTTGVDPVSRKVTWKMISSRKSGTGTLLSTHSMEEAEVLCDRIAIMSAGKRIENDIPEKLREKFENSYELVVNLHTMEEANLLRHDMRKAFPSCQETSDSSNRTVVYTVIRDQHFRLSKVFHLLHIYKPRDWGLKKSSFQSVFMSLLEQHSEQTAFKM